MNNAFAGFGRHLSIALALSAVVSLVVAQSAFAAHAVLVAGSGQINWTYGVDFDTGAFNTLYPASAAIDEFYFEIVSPSTRLISLLNSPGILRMAAKPSYKTCAAAQLASGPYNVKYNVGRWFCIQTNEGRFARFRIDSAAKAQPLAITYTTWCKPTDSC